MRGTQAVEHCRLRVVEIGQMENNLQANEFLVLLVHTSGLHAACMHRRYSPNIPICSVEDFEERTGDDATTEAQIWHGNEAVNDSGALEERIDHSDDIK